MAMIAYEENYNFHEETLQDVLQEVTNNTTRALLHNELVYLSGYFGEVCEPVSIAAGLTGYININHNRTIRTEQVGTGALLSGDFAVGGTVYVIPQVNGSEALLVNQNTLINPAKPVGICVAFAADNSWVTFRPFVQTADLGLIRDIDGIISDITDAIDLLNDAVTETGSVLQMIEDEAQEATFTPTVGSGISAVTLKTALLEVGTDVEAIKEKHFLMVELAVGADASGAGLAFTNATTGLAVGDKIVDAHVICDTSNGAGTLKLKHTGGADITAALACTTVDVLARAALLTDGVLTANGLTIIANGAADRGRMYLTYIKA